MTFTNVVAFFLQHTLKNPQFVKNSMKLMLLRINLDKVFIL